LPLGFLVNIDNLNDFYNCKYKENKDIESDNKVYSIINYNNSSHSVDDIVTSFYTEF